MSAAAQNTDHPPVPIRHMNFNFDASRAAKYVWRNNAWSSAYILTFSAFIPAGERFVIESVRAYRDKLSDPELRDRATGLIGQEAMHSKLHAEFNEMYDRKGLPVGRMAKFAERYLDTIMKLIPQKTSLAIACGIEHVTAIMAEEVFSHREGETEAHLDPMVRDFLVWHLLEELEHKSVAFDMYEEIDGSYLHRIAAFMLIWAVSIPCGLYSVDQMLKTPGFAQNRKEHLEGIGEQLGMFMSYAPAFFSYFKPGFHPDNSDTSALLSEWREKLVGKGGALTRFITKTINPGARRRSVNAPGHHAEAATS